MTNPIGQSLGRYHILEQLGEGGMATVYKAYDTRLERDVAVKVIRRDAFPPNQLDRILKRFEREAKALARLSHPNIVKVHDFGDHDGAPYLVMEYLPGGSLKQTLGKPMPWQEAVRLVIPIAGALDYAHEQNMVHRDVKPGNILLTLKGQPMLTDFGIAKILDLEDSQTLTGTGVGVGTPEYMAPEQWTNNTVPQSDIYALGVVLYELITGRKPYTADTPAALLLKQASDPLPRPAQYVTGLPNAVERMLLKALARKPEDRYGNMGEFAVALEKLAAGTLAGSVQQVKVTAGAIATVSKTTSHDEASTADEMTPPHLPAKSAQPVLKVSQQELTHPRKNKLWKWGLGGFGFLVLGGIVLLVIFRASVMTVPVLSIGSTMTREKDGMEMVFVPAGEFEMGSPDGVGDDDERPQHTVYLDDYWIDLTEVTNEMYDAFIRETGYETDAEKAGWSYVYNTSSGNWEQTDGADWQHPQGSGSNLSGLGDHPVVHVTWNDASAYCEWVGVRLPTEAEWEKAARGTDGRTYPWGEEKPEGNLVNFADVNLDVDWADNTVDDGYQFTAPVRSYPDGASPYGALDMAGNVWEWVNDWYGESYYQDPPPNDPQGPTSGDSRVLRGGSWLLNESIVRAANRNWYGPAGRNVSFGFRCSRSP